MTTYAFQFPAKIYFAYHSEIKRGAFHRTLAGFDVHIYERGKLYWNTDKTKPAFEKITGNHYWIIVDGFALDSGVYADDAAFVARIEEARKDHSLDGLIQAKLDAFRNPGAWEAQQAADIAERKSIAAAHQAEKDRQKNERALKDIEAVDYAGQRFLDGDMISWDHFEALCHKYGVKMHIRTIGSGRKRVGSIGQSKASIYGGKQAPAKVWQSVHELAHRIRLAQKQTA